MDGYGGNHQPYEQSAGLIKDWQDCGVEVGKDLLYHEPCCCETVGAEEYPQHNDEMERDEPAQHLEYQFALETVVCDLPPEFVDDETEAVHSAPEYEFPVGTMP